MGDSKSDAGEEEDVAMVVKRRDTLRNQVGYKKRDSKIVPRDVGTLLEKSK